MPTEITIRKIFSTWWPLAASWLLMAAEGPLVSAIIARLENPELNLAAFGSVAEPLRSLTSAPLIMLLAASTALSKDWQSYQKINRFTTLASITLTVLHFLLAFTPLYFVVVDKILGIPPEIVPLARWSLMIMLPLPWSIGYRRFQQGVMIRNGYSNAVVVGTIIRLSSVSIMLAIGYFFLELPGAIVAAAALTAGMFSEALYSGWRVRPIVRLLPRKTEPGDELTWKVFAAFYVPLVLTSLLNMIWRPIGSAAISRMPDAIESLAVWPVIAGLMFLFQTIGISYNEVVIAYLDKPGASRILKKFAAMLIASISAVFILMVATPISIFWFSTIAALPASLLEFARTSIWFFLPIPALAVLMSWFQGAILFSKKTRGIPEAVSIFLGTIVLILIGGIIWNQPPGVYVGAAGFTFAILLQGLWLYHRAAPVIKQIAEREQSS